MFVRFESARVDSLHELLPVGALGTKPIYFKVRGGIGYLSRKALDHQLFDNLDITVYAYLGMEDVCVPMLGHRQRLSSKLMIPETKNLDVGKDTTPKKLLSKLLCLFLNG
jgi:hypothetical protein